MGSANGILRNWLLALNETKLLHTYTRLFRDLFTVRKKRSLNKAYIPITESNRGLRTFNIDRIKSAGGYILNQLRPVVQLPVELYSLLQSRCDLQQSLQLDCACEEAPWIV